MANLPGVSLHRTSGSRGLSQDPIGRYITEAARTPLLDPEDERQLARLMTRRRVTFYHAACAIPSLWGAAARIVRQVMRGERAAMKTFDIGGVSERLFHAHLARCVAVAAELASIADVHSREDYGRGRDLMAALRLRTGLLQQLLVAEEADPCAACAWRVRRARLIHRAFVQSRNALVSANLRLVVHLARQVSRHPSQILELIQEGNVGLLYATEKYDPREECRFHSYAFWWIKQSMTRSIAGKWKLLREAVNIGEASPRLRAAIERHRARHGSDPSPYELAATLGIPRGRAQRAFRTAVRTVSLDRLSPEESALRDGLAAPPEASREDRRAVQEDLERILATLSPREREVVRLRFGLRDDDAYTLEDIAKIYNLSRERVRQIELQAMEKLRQPSRAGRLREILDGLD